MIYSEHNIKLDGADCSVSPPLFPETSSLIFIFFYKDDTGLFMARAVSLCITLHNVLSRECSL